MSKTIQVFLLSLLCSLGVYAQDIKVQGTVLSRFDDEPLIGLVRTLANMIGFDNIMFKPSPS